MRRHAKAPLAASILTGGRLLLTFAAVASFMALAASAASAAPSRTYETSLGSFGSGTPQSITVDQETGELYAVSYEEGTVTRLTSTGGPSNFSAGPDAGTNTLTGFSFEGATANEVAVDSSGNLYVANAFGPNVKVYAHDGSLITTLTGSATPGGHFSEPCGVAVDQANGDVYVGDFGGAVWRYTPSGATASEADFAGGINPGYSPCQVAADSGAVYAAEYGGGPVKRFASTDFATGTPPSPSGALVDATARALAVDPTNGDLYVDEGEKVSAFSAAGAHLYDFGSGDFGASSSGVAVKGGGKAYVADMHPGGQQIDVYSPAGDPPTATTNPASEVKKASATLNGHLSLGEDPGVTDCRFDWGASAAYGNSVPCDQGAAFTAPADVSAPLTGLNAGTTYHFRLHISTTAHGDVTGADQTFTTQAVTVVRQLIATFGSDGTSGSSLPGIIGLGLDQLNRVLYAGGENGSPSSFGLYGFEVSAGPPYSLVNGFDPLATAGRVGPVAVDNTALSSAGNVYFIEPGGLLNGYDSSGAPLGGSFPLDPRTAPGAPSSGPGSFEGIAVDSAGNIWIASYYGNAVLEYNSAGEYQKFVSTASLDGALTPTGVALDAADNMYVAESSNGNERGLWKLSAASGYTDATQITPGNFFGGIAVDPANDHLFAAKTDGVSEYDASGVFLRNFADNVPDSHYSGIAVDPANDNVYIADRDVIRVYGPAVAVPDVTTGAGAPLSMTSSVLNGVVNPNNTALTDCHFEYVSDASFLEGGFSDLSSGGSVPCEPGAASIAADLNEHTVSATVSGLDPATTYDFRLVAANANAVIPGQEIPVPGPTIVETTGTPIRTTATASFEGRVDPRGADATYRFEYGTSPAYGQATVDQSVESGQQVRFVAQDVSGLQPGTTYHYRLVADNGTPGGPTFGEDQTVTTRASEAPLTHGPLPGPPGSDRAWELVSASNAGGNPVNRALGYSDNGDRALYGVAGGLPGSQTGGISNQFFTERVEASPHQGGWHTNTSIYPPREKLVGQLWASPHAANDLSTFYAANYALSNGARDIWRIGVDGVPKELHLTEFNNYNGFVSSDDGSRIVVATGSEDAPQDPDYPTNAGGAYDITSGAPHLVSILPDGNPACRVGNYNAESPAHSPHWLTADGSELFFQASPPGDCSSGAPTQLYLRDLDAGQTTRVSVPPISGPDCGATFIRSTPGAAFFWSQSRLTSDDTAASGCSGQVAIRQGAPGADIYRYDFNSGDLGCTTCVAPRASVALDGENVAIPDNGSRVYFNSPNRLLPGASPGSYRVNVASGELAFIAPAGALSIGQAPASGQAISPDGSTLIFESKSAALNQIGGSENGGTFQYYLYNDADRSLVCASCPQNGDPPSGDVPRSLLDQVSANVPVGPNLTALDDAGDFAFSTPTALTPADQNTARPSQQPYVGEDVYEWRDGRLLLVSDGTTNWSDPVRVPFVAGFTPSGRDLFLVAPVRWTGDALDDFNRLYDARIGGGFDFPPPPPPCPLETCQGTPKGAPEEQSPGSAKFRGAGNPEGEGSRCRKGKVRRRGRCVARHPHKRHRAHRRTTNNRRAAR